MLKVEGFLCVCVCRQRGECESHCLGFGGDEQQQQKNENPCEASAYCSGLLIKKVVKLLQLHVTSLLFFK